MWRPMSEHAFPWRPYRLTVAARAKDAPDKVDVFLCRCADGGNYYPEGSILALDEMGWEPFAWTDAPPGLPEH